MVSFIWIRPPSGMASECRRRADAIEPELLGRMQAIRGSLLSYMKSNRPWNDRTTDAREGLDSNANITGKGAVTLSAFHTVFYGPFLELGTVHMRAYPIIRPALEAHYGDVRKVMDDIAG
jgi:HK97 gp10 family phage protein